MRIHSNGNACFGPDKVKLSQYMIRANKIIYRRAQMVSELSQDTDDFAMLFKIKFLDLVVHLDDL